MKIFNIKQVKETDTQEAIAFKEASYSYAITLKALELAGIRCEARGESYVAVWADIQEYSRIIPMLRDSGMYVVDSSYDFSSAKTVYIVWHS